MLGKPLKLKSPGFFNFEPWLSLGLVLCIGLSPLASAADALLREDQVNGLASFDANTLNTITDPQISGIKTLAESGDKQAQWQYGLLLYRKNQQKAEARTWFEKAAQQDYAPAWFWLGSTETDQQKTTAFYEKAAELGYTRAFGYLFDNLLFRAGDQADVAKAKKFADLLREKNVKIAGGNQNELLTTIDSCYQAGDARLPDKDLPSQAELDKYKSDEDCSRYHLGQNTPKDDVSYRKCLLSQTPRNNNSLAELYANAWGVERNTRLALALSCHASEVPMELADIVATLSKPQPEGDYLFCDHATSSLNTGYCTAQKQQLAQLQRDQAYQNLSKNWPEVDKQLFKAFLQQADEFIQLKSGTEINKTGNAWDSVNSLQAEIQAKDALLQNIRAFEQGKWPQHADYAQADKQLNAVYKQIPETRDQLRFSKQALQQDQRVWLKYRDSFVKFALNHYPTISKDVWLTWLTENRTTDLRQWL